MGAVEIPDGELEDGRRLAAADVSFR